MSRRHAPAPDGSDHRPGASGASRTSLTLLLGFVVVTTVLAKVDAVHRTVTTLTAGTAVRCPNPSLPVTRVSLTVAPEVAAAVKTALAPLGTRRLSERGCLAVSVQGQRPADTVASSDILPPDRAPDLWIPDSSIWRARISRWPLGPTGSFARSPVVIATNQSAIDSLGWSDRPPSWATAMTGPRPLAMPPTITDEAVGLSAMIALYTSFDRPDRARRALAGAVLAAGRAGSPSPAEAITAARSGSPDAPLVATTEQAVINANAIGIGSRPGQDAELIAVAPTGGSPALDYPMLTIARDPGRTPFERARARDRAEAVELVVAQLRGPAGLAALTTAGFQPPSGPAAAGIPADQLSVLAERISLLSAPSRLLTIFDLSLSMRAPAGNGQTRIAFAVSAAQAAGELLGDNAQVGFWGFSRDLVGDDDVVRFEDIAPLGRRQERATHRAWVNLAMRRSVDRLGGNGTALYATAVTGMREMVRRYDPRAGNSVVLFTDGANDDRGGPRLRRTIKELRRLNDPNRPVRLIIIGIGKAADPTLLQALAAPTGGRGLVLTDPRQLQAVLFEAMNQR